MIFYYFRACNSQVVTCLTNVLLVAWWEEQMSDCSSEWSTHGGWLYAAQLTSTAHSTAHLITLSSLRVWYGLCEWSTLSFLHEFSNNVWTTSVAHNVKCVTNSNSSIFHLSCIRSSFAYFDNLIVCNMSADSTQTVLCTNLRHKYVYYYSLILHFLAYPKLWFKHSLFPKKMD